MITETLTTSPIQVLGQVLAPNKRWVTLQSLTVNTTNIYLQFDGVTPTNLTTSNGFELTPGQSLRFSPIFPKGTDGQAFIMALGASGGELLNIQWGYYDLA